MGRILLVAVFFLAVGLTPGASHAITITAGSATVNLGDTFTIPISIAGAMDLESFQFDLSFDPAILEANLAGATAGALLPGDWFFTSPGAVDNTLGEILGVSAFGSMVSGSGVLANIEFHAIGLGISPLTLSNVFLNFLDSGFTVANGSVCVDSPRAPTCGGGGGTVPEPSTVLLLTTGLAVLAWRRRVSTR